MSKGLPPVGRCLYCGTTVGQLSREHVVPFGLGGNVVLPRASCEACAASTGALEGYCLGQMLGVYRGRLDYPSRQKKYRKSQVKVWATFDDGTEGELRIPVRDFPELLMLPIFPSARILAGMPPDRPPEKVNLGLWGWSDNDEIEAFQRRHGLTGFHVGQVDPMRFSRFLAKVAYNAAVAQLGADTFEPIGMENILGVDPTMNFYVGSGDIVGLGENHGGSHWFAAAFHEPTGMVVTVLRLFAHLEAPIYHAVVGVRPGGRVEKIMEQSPAPYRDTGREFPFNVFVG